ncbi:acylneuraminate cytidylyltransferase family protein [Helicobacter mustelae]|uniref:Acylneuraminate cytidylyltransferase n=1 Tax=Helicobacter mustelae (strain ATCC 43772 / CCUG 25715 / CIP 103759 / LMG 18044 / NCTC 12198 / R85-136P) TaxID=679897 RepID=D3UHA3_HELM1|nr:acylneuraminate cytidylyltransferase family protein [Helicobacter mustelae]CBG39875.1 acylneuraminate cytidylyltransferase [Helicobacter mustelae 12198]SQH71385.1 acylneuraminate cytidylyltransferase [Helicobacter mustelae]
MGVIALIPARSGSKGVKDKNIRDFRGLPLLAHSIHAAKQSGICKEIFVCTDSKDYAYIAQKFGANVPFLRSMATAQDSSKTIECVLEALKNYQSLGKSFTTLILLQPTSPLRTAKHIEEAYALYLKHKKAVASVCEIKEHPIFMREMQNDALSPILKTNSTIPRQDLPKIYRINGAIYINPISMLSLETSFNDNPIGYVMEQKDSLDIDCIKDFEEKD